MRFIKKTIILYLSLLIFKRTVNSASLMISSIRPYHTMTLPFMWCKAKIDFAPETYGKVITFQAVNSWFSMQRHFVFFILHWMSYLVFGDMGVDYTPFCRLFGHRFWLLMVKLETHKFTGILWTPCVMSCCISNSNQCTVHAWRAWRKSLHGIYSDLFCQKVAVLRLILIAVGLIKNGELIICAIFDLPGRLLIRHIRGFIIIFTKAYHCILPRACLF
jgi:hypothetical protein